MIASGQLPFLGSEVKSGSGTYAASADSYEFNNYQRPARHCCTACGSVSAWGILGMLWVLVRVWQGAYGPGSPKAVESMAIYWHATDLVWLMLFSLFYAFV